MANCGGSLNRERRIKRAIKSILDQSYKNIEIVVIDGSPNDSTEKVVKAYNNPRIVYVHQIDIHNNTVEDRENIIKARNRAAAISKGKYIAVLDDDDVWSDKQKLEKQIQFLKEHSDYVLVGGGLIRINKNGEEVHRCLMPETDKEIREKILFNGPFQHSAVVFRKDTYESVGGYDERSGSEAWDLFLRLGTRGKLYNFKNYFTYYLENERERAFMRNFYKLQVAMRRQHRNNYPGYNKAVLLGCLNYLYNFIPESVKKTLSPIMSRTRKFIFGSTGYKIKT